MAKAELVKSDETTVVTQSGSDGAVILSMIDKIMAAPDVPIERVERMFDLYQRSQAEQAKKAYQADLAKMQINLPIVEKRGKSHNSKYAKWEDIVHDINPVLSEYGFALSFRTETLDSTLRVTCVLSHRDGHSDTTSLVLPFDVSGKKNPIQAVGSSTSYGKRYTACAILNIAARDEDDDGAGADVQQHTMITSDQIAELHNLLDETNTPLDKFLLLGNVECITEINSVGFKQGKSMLLAKKRKLEAKQ